MDRRLLLLVCLVVWCCSWQSLNCVERRSFIGDGKPFGISAENNAIDLHNQENAARWTGTGGGGGGGNDGPGNRNLNLIERLDLIDHSLNSINLASSHQFPQSRTRTRRSAKELIKRNLAERYPSDEHSNRTLEEALAFLAENDRRASELARLTNIAQWNFDSNLTEENKQIMLDSNLKQAKFDLDTWNSAKRFNWKQYNSTIKRWFKGLTLFNQLAIGEAKYKELNLIQADLGDLYSKAKVCSYKSKSDCNLELEPELTLLLKESRDYDELKYYWTEWRNASGKKMRSKYLRYVELMNENANKNGFSDNGELWRENFEVAGLDFEAQLEEQLKTIQPFYKLLHAYVRKKLRERYGPTRILEDGPIPAHILGNMWAQDWQAAPDLLPFPKRVKRNLSQVLKEKNQTAQGFFKLAESFFKSIGMGELPEEFWKNSILEKQKDREMVCHASAWDMADGKDVRIKQCTRIEHEDLITAHHEEGHIYYYLSYANQPLVFRAGANAGFHEAIGDCIALSVQLPKHLKTIGLLAEEDDTNDDKNCTTSLDKPCGAEQDELNFLMQMALQKLAFLPFGYLIDKWRWDVFSGKIKPEEMNSAWWKMRLEYQGVCPPVERTENNFDPGAKYHVPASVPYIRYFVSHLLQFQFHSYLCDAAGHKGKLDQCDIYGSEAAGKRLQATLALGSSVPWPEAMKVISNNTESSLNSKPLLEYFEPLIVWLKKQLADGTPIGWSSANPNVCPNH